mgnify:CR=1 FL=1
MTFQSKPPQGAKTQGWPDNPSKGSKKDWNPNRVKNGTAITVVPTRQDYEKEGERRLSPTTKSKSADFPFFDMKLSKSYPKRFKMKMKTTKKTKFYWREEILPIVEDFGHELPYWGESLLLEDTIEILPAGSVFV